MQSDTGAVRRTSASQAADAMIAATNQTFPNITIVSPRSTIAGDVRSRVVAGHPVVHVETPGLEVEASRRQAAHEGMTSYVKLVWQVTGTSAFDSAESRFSLQPGDAALLPMSLDYQLTMGTGYTSLMLILDPAKHPAAEDLIHQNLCSRLPGDSAIAASQAAAATLLDTATGAATDTFALNAAMELVFRSVIESGGGTMATPDRPSARLRRAQHLVEQHTGDRDYSAHHLAHDLGMSRRSLYADFAQVGLTPASFIRRVRLAKAHREVLLSRDEPVSLTTIALRNGFADSASFSRSFKAEYGISPSALKANF